MTFRLFLAATLVQLAHAGSVLDLADLSAPAFTTFSARDGVPDAVIANVQTDQDGFVWLAAANGLARYDGRTWNAKDAPAIEGTLGTFTVDHEGTLWTAFRDRGIARWDGSAWHADDHTNGLGSDDVRRVVETTDPNGHYELWATTFGAGVLRRVDGHWVAAPEAAELHAAKVAAVARTHSLDGHERLWVGTLENGLWYQQDGTWQQLRDAHFNPSQIEDLLVVERAGEEEVWILAFADGLWRLNRNGLRRWSTATGDLPSNELYQFAHTRMPDGDEVIWIASRGGLLRVHDDHVQVFDRRHGLPSSAVRGLSVWRSPDGIDVLWVATEAGVARAVLGAGQWHTVSLMGNGSTGVWSVLAEADGRGGERLWIAAAVDGLGLYDDGAWRHFSQSNGNLPTNDARTIRRLPDDSGATALWLGTLYGGELLRADAGLAFRPMATPWAKQPGEAVVDMLARSGDGKLERWFALRQSGIYRWRDGAWTAYLASGAAAPWNVVQMVEQIDAQGRSWLWATSTQGLARFDGTQWELLKILPDSYLFGISLLPDEKGRPILWVGSRHRGILRIDASDPRSPVLLPDNLPPAPDPSVYSALRDSHNRIFLCTNNGVQLLMPTADGYASRVYTRRDGLVHDECNTNAQFIDARDRYWTGTLGGASVFDPAAGIRDTTPKPLKLTGVRLDGQAAAAQNLSIPPGRHDLRVDFALLSWNRESETEFRTQVLGFEAEPGPWNAANYRVLSALPPGEYRLRIEGRDYAGNASAPIELAFEALAAWWQRPLTQIAGALIFALVAFALVRWRTWHLLTAKRRLEGIVSNRTRELRDVNARLLQLSYTDALTGLSNRRQLLASLDAMAVAPNSDRPVALIFIDVDHFKAYNDRCGHPAGDEALRYVAAAMREVAAPNAVVARYGGEEFACLLPHCTRTEATAAAERIRTRVEAGTVTVPGTSDTQRITISAGVATRTILEPRDVHELLHEADRALYRAKGDGRNCVRS